MLVKIDTKAHFRVLRITVPALHANMAEKLERLISEQMKTAPKNIILVLGEVTRIDPEIVGMLERLDRESRAGGVSFFVTEAGPSISGTMKEAGVGGMLSLVPSFAEAVDLVMMEGLERELMRKMDAPGPE